MARHAGRHRTHRSWSTARVLVVLSIVLGSVAASCSGPVEPNGGNSTTLDRPTNAAQVLGADGQELGWFTNDASSGEAWVETVRAETAESLGAGASAQLPSGLLVTTTIRADRQRDLEAALAEVPDTKGRFAVSAIAVDVAGAGIVAVANTAPGTDLSTLLRPTGSALKFLVLAAAVQAGARPNDVIDGGRVCAIPTSTGSEVFEGDPRYSLVDVATATAFSVNCAFAKLYAMAGGTRVLELAADLGLSGVHIDSPSIAIGSAAESPLEMAGAMAAILGDGSFETPYIIESVTDAAGEELYHHDAQRRSVLSAGQAATVASMLTGVVDIGTATAGQLAAGRPFAAKTGTQENNTDAWIVGGTPGLSFAAWMGNPSNGADGMVMVDGFDVPMVQGGTYPARVAKAFLDAALAGTPIESWKVPAIDRAPVRLLLPGVECAPKAAPLEAEPGSMTATSPDDIVTAC